MKPELEKIGIDEAPQSFHFFNRVTAAFTPYWHYHPEIELTFITHGEGTRYVGNSIEPFSDNDLVLVGEKIPHHWVSFARTPQKLQKALVFQFSAHLFSPFKECESYKGLFELAKRGIKFGQLSAEIIQLLHSFETLPPLRQLTALMELLHLLVLHKDKTLLTTDYYVYNHNQQQKINKFAKVNNYIVEHLDQKLTVAQMANFTNMAPQSFCRWFKQNSGYSFITFLNKARVENACHLLTHQEMSIQSIAFSSGFESLSHFNRTFRKYKGLSPSGFAREYAARITKTTSSLSSIN